MLSAAATVCPVVHTWLNWIAIAVFAAFTVAVVAAVSWSAYDHRRTLRERRPRRHLLLDGGSPDGEGTGGHGSHRVPQPFDRRRPW